MRLDDLIVTKKLCPTKSKAQALIYRGLVWSDSKRLDKPGLQVKEDLPIQLLSTSPYVSRGGEKLESAAKFFPLSLRDKVGIDIGASTGGFTDYALQEGAKFIFAIDVGYHQLDLKLQKDPRVLNLEGINARHLRFETIKKKHSLFSQQIEFLLIDVSFISLTLILPHLLLELPPTVKDWICLYKPQFEMKKEEISRRGTPLKSHEAILAQIDEFIASMASHGLISYYKPFPSNILGKKSKNQEYFIFFNRK